MAFYTIGELAVWLGVALITLRRWHKDGKLVPSYRTPGGHRRYAMADVRQSLGLQDNTDIQEKLTVCYARVSSHDQKEQLVPKPSAWSSIAPNKGGNVAALSRI